MSRVFDSSRWANAPPPPPSPPRLTWREQARQLALILAAFGWLAGPLFLGLLMEHTALVILSLAWLLGALGALWLSPPLRRRAKAFLSRPFGLWLGFLMGVALVAIVFPHFMRDRFGIDVPWPSFLLDLGAGAFG